MIQLSKRLQAVADMIFPGSLVVDVGTDHAYLPIYLVEQEIAPKAYAMDVKVGPLERAQEHIASHKLGGKITTVLSDGLHKYEVPEEVTGGELSASLVLAGMGGSLMVRILEADMDKTSSFFELILEPQSDVAKVRRFLRTHGWKIADENFLMEDGKYYPVIKAVKSYDRDTQPEEYSLEDYYGPFLLKKQIPEYTRYLEKERQTYKEILDGLSGGNEERIDEVKAILVRNAKALDLCRRYWN